MLHFSQRTVRLPLGSILCLSLYSSNNCCSNAVVGTTSVPAIRLIGRDTASESDSDSERRRRRNTPASLPARPSAAAAADGGPSRLEPGHRHAERRAGHVVQVDRVEEVDGVGVAAVLAADAQLEPGAVQPAALSGDPDELTDPLAVDRLERRDAEDALLQVRREERCFDVVAREAPRRLGEVVRAEREELG